MIRMPSNPGLGIEAYLDTMTLRVFQGASNNLLPQQVFNLQAFRHPNSTAPRKLLDSHLVVKVLSNINIRLYHTIIHPSHRASTTLLLTALATESLSPSSNTQPCFSLGLLAQPLHPLPQLSNQVQTWE